MTTMELLKEIGALGGLAWLGRTILSASAKRLRIVDKQLLVSATTGDGYVHYMNFPNAGHIWVRAGRYDLGDTQLSKAEFVSSLERLIARGYVRQVDSRLFTLTDKGYRSAASYRKRMQPTAIPSEQNTGKRPAFVPASVG